MQGVPAIDAAQGDLVAGEQGPEQHAGGLGARQQALGLDPALELLVQPLDGVRNRYDGFDATVVWLGPNWSRCMVRPSGTRGIGSA